MSMSLPSPVSPASPPVLRDSFGSNSSVSSATSATSRNTGGDEDDTGEKHTHNDDDDDHKLPAQVLDVLTTYNRLASTLPTAREASVRNLIWPNFPLDAYDTLQSILTSPAPDPRWRAAARFHRTKAREQYLAHRSELRLRMPSILHDNFAAKVGTKLLDALRHTLRTASEQEGVRRYTAEPRGTADIKFRRNKSKRSPDFAIGIEEEKEGDHKPWEDARYAGVETSDTDNLGGEDGQQQETAYLVESDDGGSRVVRGPGPGSTGGGIARRPSDYPPTRVVGDDGAREAEVEGSTQGGGAEGTDDEVIHMTTQPVVERSTSPVDPGKIFPAAIVEVGYSSTADQDRDDLMQYIRDSGGHIRTAIYLETPYEPPKARGKKRKLTVDLSDLKLTVLTVRPNTEPQGQDVDQDQLANTTPPNLDTESQSPDTEPEIDRFDDTVTPREKSEKSALHFTLDNFLPTATGSTRNIEISYAWLRWALDKANEAQREADKDKTPPPPVNVQTRKRTAQARDEGTKDTRTKEQRKIKRVKSSNTISTTRQSTQGTRRSSRIAVGR